MEAFLRVYLPVFLLSFIALVFIVPTVRVYRQTGINPFRFATRHDAAHDFIGRSMKGFILLLLVTVFMFSVSSSAYNYLVPFEYLEWRGLKLAGLVLGHASLFGIMLAQTQMKKSWRIGIDYENRTDLVTNGLFSISRNPIFLFLLLSLVGLFLIVPNAVTFAVLFAAYLALQITMRLEEDFLQKQHGESYLTYKRNVRRLL